MNLFHWTQIRLNRTGFCILARRRWVAGNLGPSKEGSFPPASSVVFRASANVSGFPIYLCDSVAHLGRYCCTGVSKHYC